MKSIFIVVSFLSSTAVYGETFYQCHTQDNKIQVNFKAVIGTHDQKTWDQRQPPYQVEFKVVDAKNDIFAGKWTLMGSGWTGSGQDMNANLSIAGQTYTKNQKGRHHKDGTYSIFVMHLIGATKGTGSLQLSSVVNQLVDQKFNLDCAVQ